MNEQEFWEMSADGRLAAMAQEEPIQFDILCEEVVAQIIENSTNSDFLQKYSDELTMKFLANQLVRNEISVLSLDIAEVFEQKRKRSIGAHIRLLGNNEEMMRINQLQWIIDCERNKHSTTLGKTVALTRMMNEKLWGENGFRDVVMGFVEVRNESREGVPNKSPCVILSFNSSVK